MKKNLEVKHRLVGFLQKHGYAPINFSSDKKVRNKRNQQRKCRQRTSKLRRFSVLAQNSAKFLKFDFKILRFNKYDDEKFSKFEKIRFAWKTVKINFLEEKYLFQSKMHFVRQPPYLNYRKKFRLGLPLLPDQNHKSAKNFSTHSKANFQVLYPCASHDFHEGILSQ